MLTMKNSAVFLSEFPSRVCIGFRRIFMRVISGLKGNFSSDRIFGACAKSPQERKAWDALQSRRHREEGHLKKTAAARTR